MKTKSADTIKFYTRRDSATAALRKMGIHSRDYDSFIEVTRDGQFACHIARAEMYLESLKTVIPTKTKTTKAGPRRGGSAAETKPKKGSISSVARDLIRAGKSNTEVFAELKKFFCLSDDKRNYPGWYRSKMRHAGEKV